MKKLLLGMMLAVIPLVGCGEGADPSMSENAQVITREDGTQMVIEQRSAGEEAPMEEAANMSIEPSADVSASAASCWVVLQYCKPQPYCTFTNCTVAPAIKNCNALIKKTC